MKFHLLNYVIDPIEQFDVIFIIKAFKFCIGMSSVSFEDDQSVYAYLADKTFYSANRSARVSIDNVVHINGEDAYYNLTIRKLSSSVGVVKGQSMNNPDGTITIYVYPQRGCITNSGDEFCISK